MKKYHQKAFSPCFHISFESVMKLLLHLLTSHASIALEVCLLYLNFKKLLFLQKKSCHTSNDFSQIWILFMNFLNDIIKIKIISLKESIEI